MKNVELTDFIENIYDRFGLNREEGIGEALFGSKRTDVNIPLYRGEEHIDDMPLRAYMVLAELSSLGGQATVPDMFKGAEMSGSMDGAISGLLACLAYESRNLVETNAQLSPVVLSEHVDEDGKKIQHVEHPDGSTHMVSEDGRSRGLTVGGPPQGLTTNRYRLNDLSPYHVKLN